MPCDSSTLAVEFVHTYQIQSINNDLCQSEVLTATPNMKCKIHERIHTSILIQV